MTNVINQSTWEADTLFAKSQLYIGQMESSSADMWQYGLWSSLCLELLTRAALSNISPILLADTKNWRNIMHALGKEPTSKKFYPISIPTNEVLARLKELLPEFTNEIAGFCSQHMNRRNSELHSGEMVFHSLGTSEWLPKYFLACKVLLESMGKDLSDFLGDHELALSMIESLEDAVAKAVQQDIKAHAKVWSNKEEAEKEKLILQATAWATRHSGHRVECPACGSPALLTGSSSGPVTTTITEDDEVVQRQTMLPSTFECVACGLKISGYSKLSACNLGDVFTEKTFYSAAEYFELYTDDDLEDARKEQQEAYDYEPDFNEY